MSDAYLLAALAANVNNDKISDAEFRQFVRNNLPNQHPRCNWEGCTRFSPKATGACCLKCVQDRFKSGT